ncbi:hypothetical protein Tco_0187586, partial [Tanacetum coccineum]
QPSKKKQVLHDESPESKREPANRQVSRKIRTPRAVVIQEPPSVPVKKTHESSGKLKGIEMLLEAAHSSEGTGVSPRVPDELTRKSAGFTDEETNKDKNEDDVSEEEEDEEKSVSEEENVDEENEEESDDDNKSFDITNIDDERTESDSDDHEVSMEGKTVAETEEEETVNSEHEEEDTKGDNQKSEEEPKEYDQAKEAEVGIPD